MSIDEKVLVTELGYIAPSVVPKLKGRIRSYWSRGLCYKYDEDTDSECDAYEDIYCVEHEAWIEDDSEKIFRSHTTEYRKDNLYSLEKLLHPERYSDEELKSSFDVFRRGTVNILLLDNQRFNAKYGKLLSYSS